MQSLDTIARELAEAHPSDAADIVSHMEGEAAVAVLATLGGEGAGKTLARMAPHDAARRLAAMPTPEACAIVESVPVADAARLLRSADSGFVESLLANVSNPDPIKERLRYPPLSVGESMETALPAVPVHWSIGQARQVVEEAARLQCPYLYVVDASGALVGVLQIRELDRFADSPVEAVMKTSIVRLHAYSPLASILDHPAWNEYDVLPVTGRANTLVGVFRHKNLRRHGVSLDPSGVGDEAFADIALSLGELYWSSLWRVVAGFAPSRARIEASPKDIP